MDSTLSEFLVLSRGQWDRGLSKDEIQGAIDGFYAWYERHLRAGTMLRGQRLHTDGKVVGRDGTTDGPFAEAKEVVGGYWFVLAESLAAAAALMAENPTIACGLAFEIRPIDPERASAFLDSNETPRD